MLQTNRLEHLPISFFAIVMGLSGLTIAWQTAAPLLGVPAAIPMLLLAFRAHGE